MATDKDASTSLRFLGRWWQLKKNMDIRERNQWKGRGRQTGTERDVVTDGITLKHSNDEMTVRYQWWELP